MAKEGNNIMQPNEGFQMEFAMSNVDIVFGGGSAGGGKSIGLLFAMAEPLLTDPDFRAIISRRSLGNIKAGGGFVEKFKKVFGSIAKVRESENPRVSFPNGSFCDLTYVDGSDINKLRERAKGWEYDFMAVDELTELSFEAFTYLITRNRGSSKTFTGHFFATLNPKRSHWTRVWLDWYIGLDGTVIPDRNGKVRYFYIYGQTVKEVAWGDTKEEVYEKCRIDIDRKINNLGGSFTYKNIIKSFVFYKGKISENKQLIEGNENYIGSIAASGGKVAQSLLEGNFNVDPDEDDKAPISMEGVNDCFTNDPAVNGDKWLTVDLADYGTDNLIGIAWNGFHIIDILILQHSVPRDNASQVKLFAQKHLIVDEHIIFDAIGGRYMKDYIPDSVPYLSSIRPIGLYALKASITKDESYQRLVYMINKGLITFSTEIATMTYRHQNLKYAVTIQNEFMEECAVVRFDELPNGKKKLMSKKRMNAVLGRGRSMDLLDAISMRMYPCCGLQYGDELQEGFSRGMYEDAVDDSELDSEKVYNIYDNSIWN